MSGERSGCPRFSSGRRGCGCLCRRQQRISGGYILIKCHPSKACQGAKETHCGSSTPRTQDVLGFSQRPPGNGSSFPSREGRRRQLAFLPWVAGASFLKNNGRKLGGVSDKAGT